MPDAIKHGTRASPVPYSAISATSAKHQGRRCQQAPRLPHKSDIHVVKRHAPSHKMPWPKARPSAPPDSPIPHKMSVDVTASHTEGTSTSLCAKPATQKAPRCHQAPRLPSKVNRGPWEPEAEQSQPHAASATPAHKVSVDVTAPRLLSRRHGNATQSYLDGTTCQSSPAPVGTKLTTKASQAH